MKSLISNDAFHAKARPGSTSLFIAVLAALVTLSSNAAETGAATIIELSTEASHTAINDLVRATVVAEATGTTPGELSQQVNTQIAGALKTAKAYASVKTQSGSTSSYPVYAKGGKIESWRMRSELVLESVDTGAISELLGKLQDSLGVASLVLLPAPATRKSAEDQAILDAINAFNSRATMIAGTFNKTYRVKQISVNTGGRIAQPMFRAAARSALADNVAIPVESGESLISATVSGQIELE